MIRFSNIVIFFTTLFLCGCVALPLHNEAIEDPALKQIALAYEKTIEAARNDTEREWQSGWVGNMWIHFKENNQAGLCYEWKHLVHEGVSATVKQVGWQSRGIVVYEKTPHEHHAVLVFDPGKVDENKLLESDSPQPVYVLDAWRQGRADIYHLSDWLPSSAASNPQPRIFIINKK